MKLYKKQDSIKKHHGVEYKHIQSLRLLYILIGGMITFSVGLIIYFIYSNVYRALEDANTIIILQSDLGIETIDFQKLETMESLWKKRYTLEEPVLVRDPFSIPLPPITTTSTTILTE